MLLNLTGENTGKLEKPEWMSEVVTDMVRILEKKNQRSQLLLVLLVCWFCSSYLHLIMHLPREDLEKYIDMLMKISGEVLL